MRNQVCVESDVKWLLLLNFNDQINASLNRDRYQLTIVFFEPSLNYIDSNSMFSLCYRSRLNGKVEIDLIDKKLLNHTVNQGRAVDNLVMINFDFDEDNH